MTTPHPAPFPPAILDVIDRLLADRREGPILDPWAGTGRIHKVRGRTVGSELQWKWACQRPGRPMVVANTLALPFRTGSIAAVATSPCLAQGERVLTDDLRWVPVGDLAVGDGLLAFEEEGRPGSAGWNARRRWQRAVVVRSTPQKVEGVRVILANGDTVLTTPEHPWLTQRYSYGHERAVWVASKDLLNGSNRQPLFVQLQVKPWTERRSHEAGWLAGIFDGEGSLSLGVHGQPKLQFCQVEGAVFDRGVRLMTEFGYAPNVIPRRQIPGRRPILNAYVTGGFPNLLRALGELRPVRLLDVWDHLDVSTRTVQIEPVQVVAVEPAGLIEIQEVESSSGTYIGEGYLMHNSYANRFADAHVPADLCKTCRGAGVVAGRPCPQCRGGKLSRRRSYTHDHGSPLHPDNSGLHQWGPAYRRLHRLMLTEIVRCLAPGAPFVLNISNHYRDFVEQDVTGWWVRHALPAVGYLPGEWRRVSTRRMRQGANAAARPLYEHVIRFEDHRAA